MNPSTAIAVTAAAAVQNDTVIVRGNIAPTQRLPHPDPLAAALLHAVALLVSTLSEPARERLGLILATTHGCLHTDRDFDRSRRDDPRFASPAAFSRTLPSTLAAEAALRFGLRGPSMVLAAPDHSTPARAHHRAAAWLHAFSLTHCIAGAFDLTDDVAHVGLVLLETDATNPLAHNPHIETLSDLIAWIRTAGQIAP